MKRNNKFLSLILTFLLVFSLGISVNASSENAEPGGDMGIHFLDVGQGLSILVQSGGQNLIYDGGDRSSSSFVVSYQQK